jgi:hypothetical protein
MFAPLGLPFIVILVAAGIALFTLMTCDTHYLDKYAIGRTVIIVGVCLATIVVCLGVIVVRGVFFT